MPKNIDPWPLIEMRIEGTSWEEIGTAQGIDWRTVKKRVREHTKKLKALEVAMKAMR